ncbi:MAG: hypothetical protein WC617_18405 [Rhodanobacter sp.]
MSKDKADKKDKWKHLDLFDMMLKQSQVFRDMVEHFQGAWVPQAPAVVIETSVGTRSPAKKQARTARVAPVAAPAKKSAAKKAVASTKPALATVKPSSRKSPGNARAASSVAKPAAPRKTAGKAVAGRRLLKKK